ncbi:MAG: hypothetical protein ACI97A_002807 [Planctomycetota bacterium]|jgi:hypothetical protein
MKRGLKLGLESSFFFSAIAAARLFSSYFFIADLIREMSALKS